mmetsp:Transcript_34607/g.72939  ORF Transcript_34607/g.72939 Transcript_34607/m.72939 type:complete len:203 (+) Transcript_34607:954-1562(+)
MILCRCCFPSTIIPAINGTGELTKSNMSLGSRGMNADAHLYGSRSSNNAVVQAVTSSEVSPTTNTDRSKSSSFNKMISPESLIRRNRVDRPHSPATSGSGRGRDILLNPIIDRSITNRRCGLVMCANSWRGYEIRLCSGVNERCDCSAERTACLFSGSKEKLIPSLSSLFSCTIATLRLLYAVILAALSLIFLSMSIRFCNA